MVNKIKWLLYFPDAILFVVCGWKFTSKSFSQNFQVRASVWLRIVYLQKVNRKKTATAKVIQCQNVGENQMAIIVFLKTNDMVHGVLCVDFPLESFAIWVFIRIARFPCAQGFDFLTLPSRKVAETLWFFHFHSVRCTEWLLLLLFANCRLWIVFFCIGWIQFHCREHTLNQITFELHWEEKTEQKTVEADINCVNGDMGVIALNINTLNNNNNNRP